MSGRICIVKECGRGGTIVRGMCTMHYQRVRHLGSTDKPPRASTLERLDAKSVTAANGCTEWTGYLNPAGYGQIKVRGRHELTHRVAWSLTNGPIPDGLHVLHRCDNPPCCNSAHLFLGTHADNMADMAAKGRARSGFAQRTHCPSGHEYDIGNTYVNPITNRRTCRACHRAAQLRYTRKLARV